MSIVGNKSKKPHSEESSVSANEMQYNKKQAIASDKQSSEKSIASETQSPQISGDRQKLLDRFKSIRDVTLSPAIKSEAATTIVHGKARLLLWEGMLAAIEFDNMYGIHRFLKAEADYEGLPNTFGRGRFFRPANLESVFRKGNRKLPAKLVVTSQGSWYLISARDNLDTFSERAEALRGLWDSLAPLLIDGKSMEKSNQRISCEVNEVPVSDDIFGELCFLHYNTLKPNEI